MAQSGFERHLQFQMKAVKLPVPETQFRFHPTRRWTLDFAWPLVKLYCEVEGGIFIKGGGRHNRALGFEADCEKYSEAAILGWRGLRVTTGQIKSGVALGLIERALGASASQEWPIFVHPADRPLGGNRK
jgi:hypothetical protein